MHTIRSKLRKVVICCTGSIGVIDVPRLILLLRQGYGSDVHVVMTNSAQKFVTSYCLQICSGNPVITNLFNSLGSSVDHLAVMKHASICIVCPATANIIGKIAGAICDDAVTTCVQSADCPIFIVPSMNESMWEKRNLQDKVAYLRECGMNIIEPGKGLEIATLKTSRSSMPSLEVILQEILAVV